MSTPDDPARPDQPHGNSEPQPHADQPNSADQPTGADQPTVPYGQVPPAPPAAQSPYGQAPYGQAPYGQAPQGQASYGQAPTAPASPDTRPKTLAWVSLGLAVLGGILACVGFVPVPWVGLVSVIIGGLLLLVAFVLSIVALANRKQGGKPIGIIALVLSVLGGGLWIFALGASILFTAITSSSSMGEVPAPSESSSVAPDDSATDEPGTTDDGDGAEAPSGAYDEDAFVEEVRPELVALLQEAEPSITEDLVAQMFPDEALVSLGQSMLLLGDAGRDTVIESFTSTGTFDEESASRLVDAIYAAAEKHLQQ